MSFASIKTRIKTLARKVWTWLAAAALAVAAFFGYDAHSQTATRDVLTWIAPTQYVDGTEIPAGAITGYRYVWGTAAGGPYPNTQDVGNVLTATVNHPEPGYGTRCYRVAAITNGVTGEWSGEGCKTVRAPARAPTGLAVE